MDLPSKCYKVIFCLLLMLGLMYSVKGQVGNGEIPKIVARASAFCHGSKNCRIVGKGITATGEKVRRGIIAVDPNFIKLKSVVEILEPKEYAGFYTAEDKGRLIKGKIIDIWMPTQKECIKFGKRKIVIRVYPRNYKPEVKEKDIVATER